MAKVDMRPVNNKGTEVAQIEAVEFDSVADATSFLATVPEYKGYDEAKLDKEIASLIARQFSTDRMNTERVKHADKDPLAIAGRMVREARKAAKASGVKVDVADLQARIAAVLAGVGSEESETEQPSA